MALIRRLVKTDGDKSKLEVLQQQQARFWLEDPILDVFNNRRSTPYTRIHTKQFPRN
ncbi:hypothetical protein MMC31_007163 [Peltigera leucophlebia]|nr:hypothetical protein [Peltigera leucophlebia]